MIYRSAPINNLHFSWYFLAFALFWGILSAQVFSISTLHALNNTQKIPFDFPGSVTQWNINGDESVLLHCDNALCLNTTSDKKTRIVLDIPIQSNMRDGVDQLFFEANITKTSNASSGDTSVSPLSYIVARELSSDKKNLKNLGSVILLDNHSKKQLHRRIASFHPKTSHLQFIIMLRSAVTIKIEYLHFYTVTLSKQYRVARAVIFSGWVVMLLLLAFRVLSQFTRTIQVISAFSFTLMLIVGASQLGSVLTRHLRRFLEANQYSLTSVSSFSNNVSLAASHLVFHLALTVWLGSFSQSLKFSYWHLIALNLSIAIGVECAQMGIPERSADVNDLGAAILGTVAGLALLLIINTITRIRNRNLPSNNLSCP